MSGLTLFLVIGTALILSADVGNGQGPLLCTTAADKQRQDAVTFANTVLGIVQNAVKLGGVFIQDPEAQTNYNTILDNVCAALKNGWSADGVCDAIANSISDPLQYIPFCGPTIQASLKPAIVAACQLKKQQLGCP